MRVNTAYDDLIGQAESKVAEGRGGQSHRGRLLFKRYVEDIWFPTTSWDSPPDRITPTA
jgi:hypothetical protein